MINELEDRFELVKVITHFHNKEFNEVCGIYECKFDGKTKVMIRHNDEVSAITFCVNRPINESVYHVIQKIKDVLLYKVEEYLKNNESV